ncbi:hypothetical protein FKW77_010667 [Venturia effusa]|uniref:Zinc-binding loop region of homing endonuclease domain-containing protein n=1 Tax=Venturia effusa TaxID=50376 RepID=A0A517KY49_9PEZI|nr:hypothetical protein FKW77_010667 [Venturia effusa]
MEDSLTFEVAQGLCMPGFSQTSRVHQGSVDHTTLERKKEIVLFESADSSMVMIRIKKRVANVLNMMTGLVHPDALRPETWEDLGLPQYCWFNHNLDGDGSLRIGVYIDSSIGRWSMNFGTANLLVRGLLSDEEKEGIIKKGYQLSHLCGNWRCMNHQHHIVEPQKVNLERKTCFTRNDKHCKHNPPCLIWNQEDDGNHHSPNAKRFKKHPLWRDFPLLTEEEIPVMELDASTEESISSTEELSQNIQEMIPSTACRLILSDTDMVIEPSMECGLFSQ